MKPTTTLVLLADESKARVLKNEGVNKGLVQIATLDADDFEDTQVRYSDTTGRSQSVPGGASHVMDRTTSERRQARENFARHVVDATEVQMKRGGFDRFAVAAPPSMLGALRELIKGSLADKLAFDLDKDLTASPVDRLPDHFKDQIVF
jgi:protein required for attachment to host cells